MGSRRNYELGDTNQQSCFVRVVDRVVQVAAGSFSAALTANQRMLLWGTGEFGLHKNPCELRLEGVTDISVSKFGDKSFVAAIDSQHQLFTWGSNLNGQLGHGDVSARALPSQVLHLRKKKVTQISCGHDFILALGRDIDPNQKRKKQNHRNSKQLFQINEHQESIRAVGPHDVSSSNDTL